MKPRALVFIVWGDAVTVYNRFRMAKRGAFLGALVCILIGCGARSPLDRGNTVSVAGTGGDGGSTLSLGGSGGATLKPLGGSGGGTKPIGGAAGSTSTTPLKPTREQKHFLVTAPNEELSKVFAVTLDETGGLSAWDVSPVGIAFGYYSSVTLSPNGHWATIQNNSTAAFSLFDLDRQSETDLFALGVDSELPFVSTTGWSDEQHLLIDSDPVSSSRPWERWFVRIEPTVARAQVVFDEVSVITVGLSNDGKWVTSLSGDPSSEQRLELAPMGDYGVGPAVISEPYQVTDTVRILWAPNGRTVTLCRVDSNLVGNFTTYDLTAATPTAVRQTYPGFNGSEAYSPASNFIIARYVSESIPIMTVATGAFRRIPRPENSSLGAISPLDDYVTISQGSRISSIPLRNPDGSDTVNPTATLIVDHQNDWHVDRINSIRDGRELVYALQDSNWLQRTIYWLSVDDPGGSLQNLSKLLSADAGNGFSLAPAGDYVAIPSVDGQTLHLVKLGKSPSVQVVRLPSGSLPESSGIGLAWAPDDSGIILTRAGVTTTVHFLPRLADRTQGFGTLQSLSLPISTTRDLTLTLPKHWN
jgi:hypothetical protein